MSLSSLTNALGSPQTILAVLFLGSSGSSLAEPNQNELKQRILEQTKSLNPDDYAFTRTIRSEHTSGGKTEKTVAVEKFDPTKSAEGRWSLVSINGAPPPADELKRFRTGSAKRRVPGYHRLASYFGTDGTISSGSRGRTIFRFTALPTDTVIVCDNDVSQNTTADASVTEANGEPFVEQLHLTVRPMPL